MEETYTLEEVYIIVNKILDDFGEDKLFFTDFVKYYLPKDFT